MFDMDYSSESDEESEVRDLNQLNAVLTDEPSFSTNETSSQYSATTSLTDQSCSVSKVSKIETALALNKLTDEKLSRLERLLISRLHECREKLTTLHSKAKTINPPTKGSDQPGNRVFSKPYFKDKDNFPAPDNEDTKLMTNLNMYFYTDINHIKGWKMKDKRALLKVLSKMSAESKRAEITSKILSIKRTMSKKQAKKSPKLIKLQKEFENITPENTELNDDYDWDLVASTLKLNHKPQEYRAIWKLFLHPALNKCKWSQKETLRLYEIAQKNNEQDWEAITNELNTGRSGFQCITHYRTYSIQSQKIGHKWSQEEEEYFLRVLDFFREQDFIPWSKVATVMQNRTKIQLYNKYIKMIEQRKGRFLPEEDAVILQCLKLHGNNYRIMKQFIPGRSFTQLRMRCTILSNEQRSGSWTVEQDKQLMKFLDNSPKTLKFSDIVKYFPGRDRVQLRSRYITLSKWRQRNPSVDIKCAPRRLKIAVSKKKSIDSLNKAVENLKKKLQSEVEIHNSKAVTINSSEETLDNEIIGILTKVKIDIPETEDLTTDFPSETFVAEPCNMKNLRTLLTMLNAKLARNKFENGPHKLLYNSIIENDDAPLVKLKSYSRKSTVETISVSRKFNIWEDAVFRPCRYRLPPNMNTMTCLQNLLSYVKWNPTQLRKVHNFSTFVKRKEGLKEQYDLLLKRLNILFVWPLCLNSHGPIKK